MVLIGIGGYMALVLLSLSPGAKPDVAGWLLAVLVSIGLAEGGAWLIRQGRAMGDTRGDYPQTGFWSRLARFRSYVSLAGLTVLLLGLLLNIYAKITAHTLAILYFCSF